MALLILSTVADAAPATPTLSFNAPTATPRLVPPPTPNYLPLSAFAPLFGLSSNLTSRSVAEAMLRGVGIDGDVDRRGFQDRKGGDDAGSSGNNRWWSAGGQKSDSGWTVNFGGRSWGRQDAQKAQVAIATTCVDSSANDTYISSLLFYGGAGTTVYLCKDAVIPLTNAIFFSAANQTITTVGAPSGPKRAMLRVTDPTQTCAIYGGIDGADNLALRNIQIDGARPALGILSGLALIEMGGNNVGHVVDNVHAFEPRGWSVLHAVEGYNNQCSGMQITNNQIGPSGHAPSGPLQFKKRDSTGTYTPGQWADGISLACKGSYVAGNVVTDATDGGIVIFGAPGTTVTGNTVISVDRQLLGGINMVDWGPFSGSFEGTTVSGNTIISMSNFIKLGIAIGPMTWGVDNRTVARTFGGTVKGNTFSSGSTGYFGYAIGVAGHQGVTIADNSARRANFGGVESPACFTSYFPLPSPRAFVADQWTTPSSVFQPGFLFSTLVLLICRGPGSITARGGI